VQDGPGQEPVRRDLLVDRVERALEQFRRQNVRRTQDRRILILCLRPGSREPGGEHDPKCSHESATHTLAWMSPGHGAGGGAKRRAYG
jgi:hypothetical protein